jgi:hypothetical protein
MRSEMHRESAALGLELPIRELPVTKHDRGLLGMPRHLLREQLREAFPGGVIRAAVVEAEEQSLRLRRLEIGERTDRRGGGVHDGAA